jgi:hypothetical protein
MGRRLIPNAYPDRFSQMSVLLFLSDDFEGGDTLFWVNKNDSSRPARNQGEAECVHVRTPGLAARAASHMELTHCTASTARRKLFRESSTSSEPTCSSSSSEL